MKVPPAADSGTEPVTSEHADRKSAILQRLLYSEDEYYANLDKTVARAENYLKIDPGSGRVYLTTEAQRLTVPQQIRVLLIGRSFAADLGKVGSPRMGYKEIASELNRPPSGVSTELTDLVRDRDVEKDGEGLYFVPFHRVPSTLDEIDRARKNHNSESPGDPESASAGTQSEPRTRRRATRPRASDAVTEMLARPVDVTKYAWVKGLKTGLHRGLAGLLVAREAYSAPSMTCTGLEALLQQQFGIPVSRGAISMAFLAEKGKYVIARPNGREIEYSLSTSGEEFLRTTEARAKAGSTRIDGAAQ
ncbi:MAG: hypothetical protein ACHQ2Y_07130 [Candidatus Lutacidiplasmatales archaeon]